MNPTYDFYGHYFDWNEFYKELKFTVRCIPMFRNPVNEKITKNFIKIKKFFRNQNK